MPTFTGTSGNDSINGSIEADIIDGNYHIHWLEQFLAKGGMEN